MSNTLTFTIDLNDANAIATVKRMLDSIEQSNPVKDTNNYIYAGPKTDCQGETVEAANEESEPVGLTLEDVKRATKQAKADYGEEEVHKMLDTLKVKKSPQLGRRVTALDPDQYQMVIKVLELGPNLKIKIPEEGLELETIEEVKTLFDAATEEEENPAEAPAEISAEAVETALRAYAKSVGREEAKRIMQKQGANVLSEVKNCSDEQLLAIFNEVT